MKRFIHIVCWLIVGLVLGGACVGCANDDDVSVPSDEEILSNMDDLDTSSPDAFFVSYVREFTTSFEEQSDADIIGLAKATCDALDTGADLSDVFDTAEEAAGPLTDTEEDDLALLIGAGIGEYCPEYADDLD